MTREEAYSLLGLKKGCSKDIIKSAFRRKAKHVHPDINDSKNAHESFIQLTNAYDILINQKPQKPESKPQHPKPSDPFVKYAKVYQAPTDPEEYREWLIVAKARAKKVAKKEYDYMLQDIKLMKKVGKIIFLFSIGTLLLSVFCIYEVHFNSKNKTETIENVNKEGLNFYVTTDKNQYKIGLGDMPNVQFLDDSVSVHKTGILKIYKSIRFYIKGRPLSYKYYDDYLFGMIGGMYTGLGISILGILFRKKSTGAIVAICMFGFVFQLGSFLAVLIGLTI